MVRALNQFFQAAPFTKPALVEQDAGVRRQLQRISQLMVFRVWMEAFGCLWAVVDDLWCGYSIPLCHLLGDELVDRGRQQAMGQQCLFGAPPVGTAYPYPAVVYLAEKLVGVIGQLCLARLCGLVSHGQVDEVVGMIH